MNTKTTLRHALVSACFVAAAALLAPVADAHPRHHGHRNPHHAKVKVHRHDVLVPRAIAIEHRETYAPFYSGRAYFPAHRHHHATYRFPVVVNGYVQYRPYTYCGGNLALRASAVLPNLAFDIVFGREPYGRVVYGSDRYDDHDHGYGYDD